MVEVDDLLLEFCDAAIHAILAERGVYRNEIFANDRFYGLAIRRARHPRICSYIATALRGLQEYVANGRVNRLAIVLMDAEGRRWDEFLLEFEVLREEIAEEERAVEVHAALRSLMLHLQNAPYSTAPEPLVGWCLEALHRGPDLEGSWMEVDNDTSSRGMVGHHCEVHALRSVNVRDVLRVQLLLRRHHEC